jgi:toxin ParE1/3/4
MSRIRVTRRARADLDEIWSYIATNGSAESANRFIDSLIDRLLLIVASPEMGRMREELQPGMRSFVIDPYVVYYRQIPSGVVILRVLHGARDIERLFRGE